MSAEEVEPATPGPGKVDAIRRLFARKAAEIIRSDPEEAQTALEIGLIDRQWLDDPANNPISTTKPTEILEHFLERSVERKPSRLSTLGLNAIQLLNAHSTAADGEARVLTVAFTDLEGFTAFTDTNGDEAAVELIAEHHRLASPIVRRWRGRIVKHLGDGLLCTFPRPDAGVRAALELLGTAPEPLRLRAGLHTGEAIVSREDVVGHVVNLAARVTETADGNQVVLTAETAQAAGLIPGVDLRRMRTRRLKGISERVEIFQAVPVVR